MYAERWANVAGSSITRPKAEAQSVITNVGKIAKAADEHWQAAAWLLERKYPEKWCRCRNFLTDLRIALAKFSAGKYEVLSRMKAMLQED